LIAPLAHLTHNLETIDVGQMYVEQDDIGMQPCDLADRGRAIAGLADDAVALRDQEGTGPPAEPRMIVHDQHRTPHVSSLPPCLPAVVRADPDARTGGCTDDAETVAALPSLSVDRTPAMRVDKRQRRRRR
jgi:hypothetical protein